jgi:hypothetical protein
MSVIDDPPYVSYGSLYGLNVAGAAGNAFAPSFVRDPKTGKALFIHNDENNHGGVHVWSLAGTDYEEVAACGA